MDCDPAKLYLGVFLILLIICFFQYDGNVNVYCLGKNSCDIKNVSLIFIIHLLTIILISVILFNICFISQFVSFIIVLLIILYFVFIIYINNFIYNA